VEVGGWVGDGWAVRKGLSEGDTVIVDNLLKLRPARRSRRTPHRRATRLPVRAAAAGTGASAASQPAR
jgi:membrane fusion protein (multidrug efflux system)